ncbi:GntP family permease (plasmid) [Rossellomorea sp. AcN35-11]|nr:GntP family permease [Rossellomorea aquimaris]WJV31880.1 GntP family permease [Rossellomorea sp. AcN35-11]
MLEIIVGLVLLMILAYFGMSILWIAPLSAAVVALLSGMDVLPTLTDTYMGGFVGFTKSWFPVFLLGAIFGKLMEVTGAAKSVASKITQLIGKKRAILGVLVAGAILTYGGVSLFVVVFALYPIALSLFREANVSRKLLVPTFVLALFTFTMTAVPGTPQIQNLIPMDYFHTTPTAAPVIGIVTALIMAVGGYFWLKRSEKRLTSNGEGFIEPDNSKSEEDEGEQLPNWLLSIVPLVTVVVVLNVLEKDAIIALLAGVMATMILVPKKYKSFINAINEGAKGSVIATINTSAAVGFGAVVTALPAFQSVTDSLIGISDNPLISEALTIQILAMITGSASGGMGIGLEALGSTYYDLALTTGTSPEAMHRISSVAAGASILPHNGALLTLFAVTGMTHKDSYKDVAVVALIIPFIAVVAGIILASMGIL